MNGLLGRSDPAPVLKTGDPLAAGPFVLLGDHAGAAIPAKLEGLGLSGQDRARHIALDIGVRPLGEALAARLGSPFVHQAYSRLVIDCNRDPAALTAIPQTSDGSTIPGNRGLSHADRQARINEVFEPYHRAVAELLDARAAAGRETILVSLHSFTPVMDGFERPWEIGVLHDGWREDFALAVLAALRADGAFAAADNEPYRMDQTDYTVPRHAYPRGLRYLELEVRQDLIGPRREELARLLAEVFARCA